MALEHLLPVALMKNPLLSNNTVCRIASIQLLPPARARGSDMITHWRYNLTDMTCAQVPRHGISRTEHKRADSGSATASNAHQEVCTVPSAHTAHISHACMLITLSHHVCLQEGRRRATERQCLPALSQRIFSFHSHRRRCSMPHSRP